MICKIQAAQIFLDIPRPFTVIFAKLMIDSTVRCVRRRMRLDETNQMRPTVYLVKRYIFSYLNLGSYTLCETIGNLFTFRIGAPFWNSLMGDITVGLQRNPTTYEIGYSKDFVFFKQP